MPALSGLEAGEVVGAGGFAVVFRARGAAGAPVVVKLARTVASGPGLEAEARALARVGAPAAPGLHAVGRTDDGRTYLVLEDLGADGARSLASRLEAEGALAAEAPAIGVALVRALEQVHAAGLLHGDLKPENVFTGPAGARLCDLGAASAYGPEGRATQAPRVGTVEYTAPELWRGEPASVASDVYALGCVLHELASGRPPFVGPAAEVRAGHLALRPPLLAGVSEGYARAVAGCLAKSPDDRPALGALSASLHAAGALVHVTSPRASPGAERQRTPFALFGFRGDHDAAGVVGLAERFGLELAGQRGAAWVLALAADGAVTLLDAAGLGAPLGHQLGAGVTVHLVTVAGRRRGERVVPTGAEITRPDWIAGQGVPGVVLSPALAAALPPGTVVHDAAGLARLGERAAPRAFHGRARELAALADGARTIEQTGPVLWLVEGAPGAGKSRLLDELVRTSALPARAVRLGLGTDAEPALREHLAAPGARPALLALDDLHLAEDATQLQLEGALALPAPLLVVATARRTEALRPGLLARARRVVLEALSPDDARGLLEELLAPARYVPRDTLDRLAALAGREPRRLEEVAAALFQSGAIRRHPGGAWYVATADAARLPARASDAWVAAATVAGLPPPLRTLLERCALLGTHVTRGAIEALVAATERAGDDRPSVDVGFGLQALCSRGILTSSGDHVAFVSAAVAEGLCAALPAEARARGHSLALDALVARGADPATVARHAEAAGAHEVAVRAHLALADAALAAQHLAEAERRLSAALEHLGPEAEARPSALVSRGRVRSLLWRIPEAKADLAEAVTLAMARGDAALAARAHLAIATAHDWALEFPAAEVALAEARPLVLAAGASALGPAVRLAEGRATWRREDPAGAERQLDEAARGAEASGDPEVLAIARLLRGCALCALGRIDEAERDFAEAIACCERSGDLVHLCTALGNRLFLWVAREAPERALADLQRATELARALGQPQPELAATFNLAELQLWSGALDEAHALALRAHALSGVVFGRTPADEVLLLARVHLARGALAPLEALLGGLALPEDAAPSLRWQARLVALGGGPARGTRDEWAALLADLGEGFLDQALRAEALLAWARAAKGAEVREARELLRELAARRPGLARLAAGALE